jgi:ribosomal protein S6
MKKQIFFFCFILSIALNAAFAGDNKEIASQWHNAEIKIDGADSEWVGTLAYLEKEKLAYAIRNDSSAIYFCLEFDHEIQRQATMFGFTIWFDPTGKNKKTFGVRYPIGMSNYEGGSMFDLMQMRENPEALQSQIAHMRSEIEVIGPEKDDRNRFAVNGTFGIQAVCIEAPTALICEFKIPLQAAPGRPYAVGAAAGKGLSIGFEMGEMDRGKMRERLGGRGGGMPPGGFPGGGRPPGGMSGDGPPNEMQPGMRMPNPFKIWFPVKLAVSPAQ